MLEEQKMQVVGAQGTELEHDFPFGVATQLFEPRWIAADADERARLAEGAASRAADLLTGAGLDHGPSSPGDQGYSVIHGLFWLSCNLALPAADRPGGGPLLMLVDDAHYADGPSLRFLAYLARRISELPIGLVIAVRSGEATADRQALVALRNSADGAVLRPGPLSSEGVSAIVRSRFPDADDAFCGACARVTNGHPFLLTELLGQVAAEQQPPDASTAARLADLAPESVLHAVLGRLGGPAPGSAQRCLRGRRARRRGPVASGRAPEWTGHEAGVARRRYSRRQVPVPSGLAPGVRPSADRLGGESRDVTP